MTFDRRRFIGFGIGAGAVAAVSPRLLAASSARLDTAYVNGRIWTGAGPAVFTDAIGISRDRIAAVGADAIRAHQSRKTEIIDLKGAFVTPGFIDSHTHCIKGSFMLAQPSLRDAETPEQFVRLVAEAARALPAGQWLEGGNWDQDRWGGRLPDKSWIDPVTPDVPVAVIRYDLHMLLLNSVALRLAGIDRNTPDVPGGVIERDARGEPTGIIKDAAKALVQRAIGDPSLRQIDAAVQKGIALGLSKGVTQVDTPELDWNTHDAVRRIRARGETGMRFYSLVPLQDWAKMDALIKAEGHGDDWVRWGGCKIVFDGSLGSRTALFYEPYLDEPGTRGIMVTDPADLHKWVQAADAAGLQVAVHAIGDRANDIVLDVMAAVAAENGPRDRRFRIEHAQHLTKISIPRFAKQNIIASVQPYHAVDDGRWAVRRIGPERLKATYAFRSLLATGAKVCLGSDWPVAPLDPLTGLKAAVLRETLDGKNPGGWYPEQRLSLAQSLAGYTRGGAYACFRERKQGLIAPGYLADFAVFDRDLFTTDPESIDQAKVVQTVVGGVRRFG